MSLAPGTRLGFYEVVSLLGKGGMGEVYRARDTKLGRDVALKFLPDIFLRDPDRVARFQREAQVLAALNHPNIAAIYGLEESDSSKFLVLELVEGETLAQKLAHGPEPAPSDQSALSFDEALFIARQIADALQAAHEKGIIHRDLKPANIALTPDGYVKVLDFGLAKAMEPMGSGDTEESPTMTLGATQAGVIMGTAAYMSPEQAKGRAADKRSDVWSFGCVLYEMLTGRRPFEGEDVGDTLATVIKSDPDWDALPPETPPHLRTLVRRCLVKDRRRRLADISVALYLMEEAAGAPPVARVEARPVPVVIPPPPPSTLRTRVAVIALASLALLMAGAIVWMTVRWPSIPALRVARFAIVPPAAQPFAISGFDRDLDIAPDGTRIVYRAGNPPQLFVRSFDQLEAVPLGGLGATVQGPFLSPDGRWVGFNTGPGGDIKKVSITGGPALIVCHFTGNPRGATWGADDTIVFATSDTTTGLLRVAAGGAEPQVLTKPDPKQGEQDHQWPSFLPAARGVLFTITAGSGIENAQVAVIDLRTGQKKILVRGGSHAQYVNSGHLVYAVQGSLRAVRFDLARLEVVGDPVPVLDQVVTTNLGSADFTVSGQGTLVYVGGGTVAGTDRSLVWVNRQGREEPIKVPPRAYFFLRLSPDGTRVAVDIRDQESDVWVWEFARETLTRLTFGPQSDSNPVWTPDGRRLAFASLRDGQVSMFWQPADGTGTVEKLTKNTNPQVPESFSPDGTRLVFREIGPKTTDDIGLLALDGASGERRSEPLVQTTFAERNAAVSPDGLWVAYQSLESGQWQVYVRPFPKVEGGRWQVSTNGGTAPLWARNGRELFYIDFTRQLMAVPVRTTSAFTAGNPTKLFDARYFMSVSGLTYDVSPDGQRFLMIKEATTTDPLASTPPGLVVVQNWLEELKAKVGEK